MTSLATTRAINRTTGHLYSMVEMVGDGQTSPPIQHGPYPGATAITGLQDSLGGAGGLMNWAVGLALDEVWNQYQSTKAGGYDLDSGDVWPSVRAAAFQAQNKPRDMGIAVHAVVDQINRGQTPTMFTDGVAPYVAQYGAALYQQGIKVLGSERYAVNTDIGFGGTYDSLVEIDGERGMLDVKTGKPKPSQRLQLTGLSMCQWHGEAGLEAEPMPELSGVGWILLLKPDGYELVRHEITEADREHFVHLVDTYHRIRGWAAQFTPTVLKEAA